MRDIQSRLQSHELTVGDRIDIQPGHMPLALLVGRMGTVVEVFRVPHGSCLARIDDDPDGRREWFFYRAEVHINNS